MKRWAFGRFRVYASTLYAAKKLLREAGTDVDTNPGFIYPLSLNKEQVVMINGRTVFG